MLSFGISKRAIEYYTTAFNGSMPLAEALQLTRKRTTSEMTSPIPTLIDMCAHLIAAPSVSSVNPDLDQSNRGVVDLLADWLSALGLGIELMPVAEQPEKLNLLATIGEGTGGLVLSGHTDTVPYDQGAWRHDPFVLTEQSGSLYGLGAADMKCFFAVVLDVLRDIDAKRFKSPLVILATADEESSMSGARALVQAGRRLGDYALIGEPTGLKPIYMHKGVMMESIKVHGRSGHASNPALGENAIEGMQKVIGALLDWRGELQGEYQNSEFQVSVPTLNLGSIQGGDNPNRICADCELQIDLRLLPGMEPETMHRKLDSIVEQALTGTGLRSESHPLFAAVPPFENIRTSEIIRVAERLTEKQSGTVAFATEAPFFAELEMETVILGPGNIDQAHQPDEFVTREHLEEMRHVLKGLIGHFCLS